jgi:hypothetical protein
LKHRVEARLAKRAHACKAVGKPHAEVSQIPLFPPFEIFKKGDEREIFGLLGVFGAKKFSMVL